jgi:hypothetical protein
VEEKGFIPVLMILVVLVGTAAAGGSYLLVKQVQRSPELIKNPFPQASPTASPVPSLTAAPSPPTGAALTPTGTRPSPGPDVVKVDSRWNHYINHRLGYSLQIPQQMSYGYGSCEWKADQQSFRPKVATVPTTVIENNNFTFITSQYYYQLGGERQSPQGAGSISYFASCDRVNNTLVEVADSSNHYEVKWEIVGRVVNNEAELLNFVRERYGRGCNLGERIALNQEDSFDVKVASDGREMGESQCVMNFVYALIYSPSRHKAITWGIGQSCSFRNNEECLDTTMRNSFRFE